MPGAVLEGLKVLDLSWGIAGPMATMLLADHGAAVTRIEPPGGDPFRTQLGYRTWQRGKRSAVLDLKNRADRDCLLALAREADILVESYSPGVTERLGIDYARLHAVNPRLIYCSITAYGRGNRHSEPSRVRRAGGGTHGAALRAARLAGRRDQPHGAATGSVCRARDPV